MTTGTESEDGQGKAEYIYELFNMVGTLTFCSEKGVGTILNMPLFVCTVRDVVSRGQGGRHLRLQRQAHAAGA